MLASESCTLNINGFEIVRDILPGEAVIITLDGKLSTQICHPNPSLNLCIFEYAYLARADSVLEQVPVQMVRQNMGKYLARQIKQDYADLAIDVVIPVPDIARTIAIAAAQELGLPCHEGFVKNHLIDNESKLRNAEQLQIAILNKLSPISLEFKDKNILLVDISVVRGINSREIISIIRRSGAKRVYLASAAPKVQYSSVYGIDMPAYNQLIAHQRSDAEVATAIGADRIIYQTLDNLKLAIHDIHPALRAFEASCFDGNYITQDIDDDYLRSLANGVTHA